MAVCKRCGTSFDYNKRDGVCPKCCFYNRPDGTWQDDDSWVKNYNYEDNSYSINVHEEEYNAKNANDSLKDLLRGNKGEGRWARSLDHKEISGSHVHTSDGRVVKTSTTATPGEPRKSAAKKNKNSKLRIFFFIVALYYIITILMGLVGTIFN